MSVECQTLEYAYQFLFNMRISTMSHTPCTIFADADSSVLIGGGRVRGIEGAVQVSKGGRGGLLGADRARNSGAAHLYARHARPPDERTKTHSLKRLSE